MAIIAEVEKSSFPLNFGIKDVVGEPSFDVVPENLIDSVLSQKLWEETEGGNFLYVFLQRDENFLFQKPSVEKKQGAFKKVVGAIIKSSSLEEDEKEKISDQIGECISAFRYKKGTIFVLEEKGRNVERNWRKDVLSENGLVLEDVVQKGNHLLWRGRLPRARISKPVNLLEVKQEDPFWKIRWRQNIIPDIIKRYRSMGFEVVDLSKIKNRLEHSRMPLEDLARVQDGCGVIVKDFSCGLCLTEITIRGDIVELYRCGDHQDEATRLPEKSPMHCECGIEMYWDKKAAMGGKYVCPHCGNS